MKKNKKGFSLIELLVFIFVLSILVVLGIYSYTKSADDVSDKKNIINEQAVLKAGEIYSNEYEHELIWEDNNACIPVKLLVNKGYFKQIDIDNNGFTDKSVIVLRNENDVNSYKLISDIYCDMIDDVAPIITINGDNPLVKNYKSDFNLWSDVSVYDEKSMIDEEKNYIEINSKKVNNLNELDVGEYVAVYHAFDMRGNEATMDRNIKVVDNISPTISFITPITKQQKENYELNSDVEYIDNESGIDESSKLILIGETPISNTNTLAVGSYDVIYKVKDLAGNETTETRKVNIAPSVTYFYYKGYPEEYDAFVDGYYYIEAYGASGGTNLFAGLGGKVSGYVYLKENDKLKINVGGMNSYNGGGTSDIGLGGGGASTVEKDNEYLMIAAGGGSGGIRYFSQTTSDVPVYDKYGQPQGGDISSISTGGVSVEYEGAIGGDGDGKGAPDYGYGKGNDGVNGGAGAGSRGVEENSKVCTELEEIHEETTVQGPCINYEQTCVTIPNSGTICFPGACKEYLETVIPSIKFECRQYVYQHSLDFYSGNGGKSSVSNDVINSNFVHGNNSSNGKVMIKFVGDTIE